MLLTWPANRSTMSGVTTIPVEDDFLADDLDQLPDDGKRYELVDGLLLVSPAQKPSVTVLELQHGAYVEVARASGGERLVVRAPYALELVPDVLLR